MLTYYRYEDETLYEEESIKTLEFNFGLLFLNTLKPKTLLQSKSNQTVRVYQSNDEISG